METHPTDRLVARLHEEIHEMNAYVNGLQGLVSNSRDGESLDITGPEFDRLMFPISARLRECLARINGETPAP